MIDEENFFKNEEISEEKIAPIKKTKGPCLILAGAGTGKTKTITGKIAYLIKKIGIKEDRILCLTFSNSAAGNLKEKVSQILKRETSAEISTFHSFCSRILQEHGSIIGIPYNFKIIDDIDALIILSRMDLTPNEAKSYAFTISQAKDLNIKREDYVGLVKKWKMELEGISPDVFKWEEKYKETIVSLRTLNTENLGVKEKSNKRKELLKFKELYEKIKKYKNFLEKWEKYEEYKKQKGLLDYADLNLKVLELLKNVEEDFLRKRYDYIIVDEFQDTSYIQFELLKKLVNKDRDITVVGDKNQTIYAFRGAFVDNVDDFKKEFEDTEEFRITENFRSTQEILDASYSLIKNNYEDESSVLKLFSKEKGEKPLVIECKNGDEEARRIVEIIDNEVKQGRKLSDIFVLYRSHSQGETIKMFLQNRGYPINVSGGTSIFLDSEILTVSAFLEIIANFEKPYYKGEQSWWKVLHRRGVLNQPDSIKIAEYKKLSKKSLQYVLYHELDKVNISKNGREIIEKIKNQVEEIYKKRNYSICKIILSAYELLGIVDEFRCKDDFNSKQTLMNLKEFYLIAENFEENHSKDIADFVDYLRILDELNEEIKSSPVKIENSINLMTVHASKGLESPVVILSNMVENRFPITRTGGNRPLIPFEIHPQFKDMFADGRNPDENEIKERESELMLKDERKLCYVAMTRAQKKLFFTYAINYTEKTQRKASEFLDEVRDFTAFEKDEKITEKVLSKDSNFDRTVFSLKEDILKNMDNLTFEELNKKIMFYKSLKNPELISKLSSEDRKNAEEIIKSGSINEERMEFPVEKIELSFSSLSSYIDCPKRFEIEKILGMPSIYNEEESSDALNRGSFIHEILETAVFRKIKTKEELFAVKEELSKLSKYSSKKFKGVDECLSVFWIREKNDFSKNMFTEKKFNFELNGFKFTGKIDRIDLIDEKNIHIIDYKTGTYPIELNKIFLQLGMYALAVNTAEEFKNFNVKKLSLFLLEQEDNKSYNVENGILVPVTRGNKKPLAEIEKEILEASENIKNDFKKGFERSEKNCDRCPFKFYCK